MSLENCDFDIQSSRTLSRANLCRFMVDVSIPPAEHIDLNIEALHHLGTMAHENYEDDRAFSDEQDPEQEQ